MHFKKIKIPQEEIELSIQEEQEKIEKLIETNKNYAKLLMDLQVYRNDNTCNMVSLTQFAKRKNEPRVCDSIMATGSEYA